MTLNEILKTTYDLKSEFTTDIEIVKKTQTEMNMTLKNSVGQLETREESLTSRVNEQKTEYQDWMAKLKIWTP